jgi:hypothetical protein
MTTPQEKFEKLTRQYNTTIQITSGCGERGQYSINDAHEKLVKFAQENPEYKERIPQRPYRCQDDGAFGMAYGFGAPFWR